MQKIRQSFLRRRGLLLFERKWQVPGVSMPFRDNLTWINRMSHPAP
jgi:hypothetical protein